MSSQREQFTVAWGRDAPRLLVFARRHVGAVDAPDIVAETFTIAWRRWVDVPTPPAHRPRGFSERRDTSCTTICAASGAASR